MRHRDDHEWRGPRRATTPPHLVFHIITDDVTPVVDLLSRVYKREARVLAADSTKTLVLLPHATALYESCGDDLDEEMHYAMLDLNGSTTMTFSFMTQEVVDAYDSGAPAEWVQQYVEAQR